MKILSSTPALIYIECRGHLPMEEPPLFRVPKRRKIARLHPDNDEAEPSQETESNAFDQTINESDDENTFSIVRARKPARKARGGINFTTTSQIDPGQTDSMALVPADGSSDRPQDMSNRFTSSTGQVVDVDRHMYVYPCHSHYQQSNGL